VLPTHSLTHLFLLIGLCAEGARSAELISRPAGFVRVSVPARGQALISLPFLPSDPRLDALLPVSAAAPGIVRVRIWDAAAQQYITFTRAPATDELPAQWTGENEETLPELWPGEGFWIENAGDTTANVYLCGAVCLEPSMATPLLPGLNALGYPYAAAPEIAGGVLAGLIAEGDELWRFHAGQLQLAALMPEGWLGWVGQQDAIAGAPRFELGTGYLYRQRAAGARLWQEPRPYPAPFPPEGTLPAIADVRISPGEGEIRLTVLAAGLPGERYEVFTQELPWSGCFDPAGVWALAGSVAEPDPPPPAENGSVEPAAQTTGPVPLRWHDFGGGFSGRPAPARAEGRVYLVARADTDADGDGLPDPRETLAHRTDPHRADSDGDGMPDGWELSQGLDPLRSDGAQDADGDGLSNAEEFAAGTSARFANRANLTFYVDAAAGDDRNDGRAEMTVDRRGPKRTVRAAFAACIPGDTVVVKGGSYPGPLFVPDGVHVSAAGRVEVGE
jgi:hypothetical protein